MFLKRLFSGAFALLTCALISTSAQAHLMVAQHGTLNFLDDSVYLVISLPASAFEADEDKDGLLSLEEFTKHRKALIDSVAQNVTLSDKKGKLELHGIMISPAPPHDSPKDPSKHIIAMGRYAVTDNDSPLHFKVGLFGNNIEGQTLEITASKKSENQKHVFELSPKVQEVKLKL